MKGRKLPAEAGAIILRPADLEKIIVESFEAGERNFFERASACLPAMQLAHGIDAGMLSRFDDYLRVCAGAPSKSTRLMRLIRRIGVDAGVRE
jgi:hypothetical protein